VKKQAVLGLLVGVLMTVPLVLLLVMAQQSAWRQRAPVGISPVLSREERLQRVTYQRSCRKSADCEPPLGCLKYPQLSEFFCTDSQCITDAQCEEGKSCQAFITEGDGPRVRACITQGVRHEGEECSPLPDNREQACAPGLRCLEGWCGRPCRLDAAEGCPEGFFCADDVAGPVCLPTCEGRDCPEGQQCVRFPTRKVSQPVTACRQVHGTNCRQSPCAEGQRCIVNHVPDRPHEVWMACMQRCGHGDEPACPDGLICVRPYCRQPCEPQVPGACGPAMRCEQLRPDERWVCRPEL
jgi:hypothetical protein